MRWLPVATVCFFVALVAGLALFASGPGTRPSWIDGLFLFTISGTVALGVHALVRWMQAHTSRELDDIEKERK